MYWIGFVDEAAKKEPRNGISYGVEVYADTDIVQPLRATARIVYKTYDGS